MDNEQTDSTKDLTKTDPVSEDKNDVTIDALSDDTPLTEKLQIESNASDFSVDTTLQKDSTVVPEENKSNIVPTNLVTEETDSAEQTAPNSLADDVLSEDKHDSASSVEKPLTIDSMLALAGIKTENTETVDVADEFYNSIQRISSTLNKESSLSYVTSRSTSENVSIIEKLSHEIETICKNEQIPVKESASKTNNPSVNLFKYLICNTNFASQSLLEDDLANGHFVDMQPPFSSYLLMEILWHLHFEEILAESVLYLPLDLCYEILEVLPRCLDLLEFERSSKFLSTIIPNVYKKLMMLKDTGTQTQDVHYTVKRVVGTLQELILQCNNERFLRLEGLKKVECYKRQGVLLKKIIQMVKTCFTCESKDIQLSAENEKMYKLTFGSKPLERIGDGILQEYFKEIHQELTNLLLSKVKEINCNVYLNWMEYEDQENTSLTLQRAVGLECYYFVEHTKKYKADNDEYNHLVECILQIASKPDPENKVESLQIEDLNDAVAQGKQDCMTSFFKRYKEWNDDSIELIDKHFFSLTKEDCEELFEYFAAEIRNASEQSDFDRLKSYSRGLFKSFIGLTTLEAYELSLHCVLRHEENENIQNVVNIENFERFIMLNPNFTTPKNLRVVLFYLSLQAERTLKVIFKIALSHSDYPDVAVKLEDLMSLLPVMKIRVPSQCENLLFSMKRNSDVKSNGFTNGDSHTDCSETVSLVVKTIQDICLESTEWNPTKLTDLLCLVYSFCEFSEVINEIFTPLLASESCSLNHVKWVLSELDKLSEKFDSKVSKDLPSILEKQAFGLYRNNDTSRFLVDESLTLISDVTRHLFSSIYKPAYFNVNEFFLVFPPNQVRLTENIECIMSLLENPHLKIDDVVRYIFTKCTNQHYSQYVKEISGSFGAESLNWSSKLEVYDNLIRLAFESCLISLEHPETGPQDAISYTIRRLHRLISRVRNSGGEFTKEVCQSLEAHAVLMNPSAEQSAVSREYTTMLNSFHESDLDVDSYLTALDLFAHSCLQKSSMLKNFEGTRTQVGRRLWLAHDAVDQMLSKGVLVELGELKLT